MRFHYDLAGAEPIIRDVQVYDAGALAIGELVMLGTTAPGTLDYGVAFVTAYTASAAECDKALGILMEANADADSVAVNAAGIYLKAVINPFAVYLAEYDQATTMSFTTTTTTFTVTSLEDNIDCGWAFAVTGAVTGNTGALRFFSASAAGSATIIALAGGNETGGTAIKILPRNHALTALNTAATKLLSAAAAGSGTELRVIENYIESAGHSMQPLRYSLHSNLNSLSVAKFYADVVMLDHIYNPNIAA